MTTTTTDILFALDEAVATITLNRPDSLNSITPAIAARLGELYHATDADPQVRAIVLTGSGRGFCAGADLSVLRGGMSELAASIEDPATFPNHAMQIRKPVIAAVNGPAAGVGFAYLAAADVRFAAESARFTLPFARLGLVAEYGMSWLLVRLVGHAAATDLLMSGRTIDAAEALRIGLVSAVLPDDELLEHATGYARDLARRCSPRSLAAMKQQLSDDSTGTYQAAFDRSVRAMVESLDAPDLPGAMAAMHARRDPEFPPLPPLEPSEKP